MQSSLRSLALLPLLLIGCAPSLVGTDAATKDADGLTTDDGDGDGDSDGTDGGDGADGGDGGDGGGPVDADGDGFTEDVDCDDSDADINPDAEEIQNGEDDDCDGYVDEIEVCESDWETLQEAIDEAPDGATLLICPGEYREQLTVTGRELTLVGIEGPRETIVTAEGDGRVLTVGRNSELTIQGLTLRDGKADVGGIASCENAELVIIDSVLESGEASATGGILHASGCDLDTEDTRMSSGVALGYGGALYASNTRGTLTRTVMENSVGLEGGGAFINEGDLDIVDSEIVGNQSTSVDEDVWGPGAGGGGLWTSASDVSGTRIAGNHSAYSGGGAYFYRGRPTFEGNTVEENTCGEDGAGVFFNVSTATISNNVFQSNAAADDAGGLRLYFGNSTIDGNEFYENTANDDGGGAKFSHSEHTFTNNVLERNVTGDAGGGLELDNDSTDVHANVFRDNRARRGAGLHNWTTERRFTIKDTIFEGNVASDCGGALQFDNNPYRVTLTNLWIEGNEAVDGAGICTDRVYRDPEDVGGQEDYYQDSILTIENTVFTGNDASDDGGAVYLRAASVDFVNVVMDNNEGPGAGAMSVKGATATLTNTILSNNDGGPVVYVETTEDAAGSVELSYSNIWQNDNGFSGMESPVGSDGNIDENPDFASTSDYTLDSSSPCIDAGDPTIRDRDGSRSDMGLHGGPSAP